MNKPPNENPEPKKGVIHNRKPKPDHVRISSSTLSSEPQQHKRILVVENA